MIRRSTGPAPGAAPVRGRRRPFTRAVCAAAVLALVLPPAPAAASPSPGASDGPSAPSASPSAPSALPQVYAFGGANPRCVSESATMVPEEPWTHVSLGLDAAHELTRGAGTTVAVLAGAVTADGPALSDAVDGAEGDDCLGHGTFLAGIVGAREVAGSGFVGVAPEAGLVAVPTGDARTGLATAADVAAGLEEAVAAEADVVLVGTGLWEGGSALDDAVAAAAEADVLVVAPATVAPESEALPSYPAQDPAVLSVGSYDPNGAMVLPSALPMPEGEETARTDVAAPGTQVLAVGPGGGHFVGSGDAVAAAFAAGTAALVRAHEPDLTAEQVRDRLMATAYGMVPEAEPAAVGRGPIDPMAALTGSPEDVEADAPGAGEPFTAGASGLGTWNVWVTVAVAGSAFLLIVACVLTAAVLRRGRARAWRPARGAPDTPDDAAAGSGQGGLWKDPLRSQAETDYDKRNEPAPDRR
jgi:hypothetical protein